MTSRPNKPVSSASPRSLEEEANALRQENDYLRKLLEQHGITSQTTIANVSPKTVDDEPSKHYSVKEKITLFRNLFRGRADVYPVRWESKGGSSKSGYSPACGNEWRPGICDKRMVRCAECGQRRLLPVTDEVIYNHLSGKTTIGVYPLLPNDHCWFLAVDFDKAEWRDDALGFFRSCRELDLPAALEISRSGKGAHVWIFFSIAVPAVNARRLGAALISHTCIRNRQLELTSYDRLFPNQDRMPSGGFGNLIALPLQKEPRARGCSLFVDDKLEPIADQWQFLGSIERVTLSQIENTIGQAVGDNHPLDIAFITEEDELEPWQRAVSQSVTIGGALPKQLDIVFADRLYFEKAALPRPLQNRLVRLAAFQNPEFYKAQALRLSVWNKPRIIGCADNLAHHIALPRGCLDEVLSLLDANDIDYKLDDKRMSGDPIKVEFTGTLRPDQEQAVTALLKHDTGVLSAPTAFGKTVTAAAIIAKRGVNTLILVHRKELMQQWRERLNTFLDIGKSKIGGRGGGRKKLYGIIDIAIMQSLVKKLDEDDTIEQYGQVIVDECHHISASSYEALFKRAKGRYVLGLTATPIRRDGWHPIIFMQCGPIRHRAAKAPDSPQQLEVIPHFIETPLPEQPTDGIQQLFNALTQQEARNRLIAEQVIEAYRGGHKILLLSERTAHLLVLEELLREAVDELHLLHGRLPKKKRNRIMERLGQLPPTASRVILASGKLIGEGFDHPPLDTLFLTFPLSWKGTLQQYAGRLHRSHEGKEGVRIHDYIDSNHAQLMRMWLKRLTGYKVMGYRVVENDLFQA
ncbi:MAG: DEAD/DEAH box helicase family protein [Gammaproteobacteria bacterium]|nr:DEAD/DEAH box helicase family protein [Gammaproteobacteria bacterium]